jgi:lipid A disaccharide synthetase
MVVIYRASWLDWNLFWPMINVESVALPNLIAGAISFLSSYRID